eukprot:952968_1
MNSINAESPPAVKVFKSLEDIPNGQRDEFLSFLSKYMGYNCSETGRVSDEVLESWGTSRIFVLESSSGVITGTGLILKTGDFLSVSGLCYDEQVTISGQRILESIVSTWENELSNLNLSVDFAKGNYFIQGIARFLGFSCDQVNSDDSWSRFLLSAHAPTKLEPDIDPQHIISGEVSSIPECEWSAIPYKCNLCQKEFVLKHNLKKHRRTVHANDMVWCDFCEESFKFKSQLKTHVQCVHEKLNLAQCKMCAKTFRTKVNLIQHIREIHD